MQTFAAVDIAALLERLYQFYLPVAEDCRHPLSRTVQQDLRIRGDPELLTQLFSNLVENAIRHTPPGTNITHCPASRTR